MSTPEELWAKLSQQRYNPGVLTAIMSGGVTQWGHDQSVNALASLVAEEVAAAREACAALADKMAADARGTMHCCDDRAQAERWEARGLMADDIATAIRDMKEKHDG